MVGGCVRDMLLKKDLNDYDFACVHEPDKVQEILADNGVKSIPTGKKFGTITAVVNGKNYEITTLRDDVEADGRHAKVEFKSDYAIDAKRRDFTVNALYIDKDGKIYDYFGGIDDLKAQKIRFIGDANQRIEEDYLRVLRFFRFSLRYSNSLDEDSVRAIAKNKVGLAQLSRERIRQEYFKILTVEDQRYLLEVLGVMKDIEVDKFLFTQMQDVGSLKKLFDLSKEFDFAAHINLRLACLFLGENLDENVFYKEICATRLEKKYFIILLKNKIKQFDDVKILLANYEKDFVRDMLVISYIFGDIEKEDFERFFEFVKNVIVPEFPVTNQDIIAKDFKGSEIGNKLKLLKDKWALSRYTLTRLELLDIVN